jgi:dTDP-4-dehydrorhamnose reductase
MKILVTGAKGQVGSEIMNLFASSEYEVIALTRKELDCTNISAVPSTLSILQPDLVINTAAYTAVDKAEDEVMLAHVINADFVQQLALYCAQNKIPLIHLSTDYVFDGTKTGSYSEIDRPNPQGVYAQSKFLGEQAIISCLANYIILRVSWVFGIHGSNFVKTILNLASTREELNIVADQWGRPTAARDIARVILKMVQEINGSSFSEWGIYHYAGEGSTNWYEFSHAFVDLAREKGARMVVSRLNPIRSEEYITKAVRPKNSILNTSKIEQRFGIRCHGWNNYLPEIVDDFIQRTTFV